MSECLECKKMKKAMYSAKDEAQSKKAALRAIADAVNDNLKSPEEKMIRVIDVLRISGAYIKNTPIDGVEEAH